MSTSPAPASVYEVHVRGNRTHLVIDGQIVCGAPGIGQTVPAGKWNCKTCGDKTPPEVRRAAWDALQERPAEERGGPGRHAAQRSQYAHLADQYAQAAADAATEAAAAAGRGDRLAAMLAADRAALSARAAERATWAAADPAGIPAGFPDTAAGWAELADEQAAEAELASQRADTWNTTEAETTR